MGLKKGTKEYQDALSASIDANIEKQ